MLNLSYLIQQVLNNQSLVKQFYDILLELKIKKPLGPCIVPAWALIDDQSIIVPH